MPSLDQRPPILSRTHAVYWVTQLIGWGLFTGLFLFWNYLEDQLTLDGVKVNFIVFLIGITVSHYFRGIIVGNGWLDKDLGWMLPRLALWSVILGIVAFLVLGIIHDLSFDFDPLLSGSASDIFGRILNWVVLLFLWSLCYLGYTYFIRHRREEIRNLRLQTANHENQLQNLRAQMNPHFMFNALNSIRALVDEDPDQAKRSITQLSAILRNAMATVKRRTVPLGEELDIVKAYLGLEHIRYEERLRVYWNIEPDLDRIQVPPMLLQTLVENAVRHGVAKYAEGGDIHIGAQKSLTGLVLSIRNSGHFDAQGSKQVNGGATTTARVGIGLRNTRRRLEMLYKGEAHLKIQNLDGMVVTEVEIPDQK